jgi:hypothetical protein
MNPPGSEGEIHYVLLGTNSDYDIDLNGGPGGGQPIELWCWYPGRVDSTLVGTYITSGSGDLDVYNFHFNETGDFLMYWAYPVNSSISNIETMRVVTEFPPTYIRSFIYVGCSPNPVGVGQETVIVAWTADMPPDIGEQRGGVTSPTGRAGWYDMTIELITPDGTNETLAMPYSDPVGANWITYTPAQSGNFTVQAYFKGNWKNSTAGNILYESDTSDAMQLVVQDAPITAWQEPPLPNDHWTRPINTMNRLWYPIAGNWLGGAANNYPPGASSGASGFGGFPSGVTSNYAYGAGCETPHILWTRQYAVGGLMDERYEVTGYQTAHYQGLGFGGIILNGIIHYTPRITHASAQGWEQVNLYTGDQLFLDWDANGPSFGQIYDYESPNQHGGFPYLWRTSGVQLPETVRVAYAESVEPAEILPERTRSARTMDSSDVTTGTLWELLDGYTGKTVCYIANVSSGGAQVYGKDGSILRYDFERIGGTYYLQCWNTSHGTMPSSQTGTGAWQWRPAGGTFGGYQAYLGGTSYDYVHDGRDFFSLNVSVSLTSDLSIRYVKEGEYMIGGSQGSNDESGVVPGVLWKISLEDGQEGQLLWHEEFIPPSEANRETVSFTGVFAEDGMFCFDSQRTVKRWGYSLDTMQQVWESEPETQFQYYGFSETSYNGILYSYGYGGEITAYDIKTGDVLWKYRAISEGFESTYGGNYPIGVVMISDGKLYTVTGEHSPTQPLYRGHNLRCINATTGEDIWKIMGWFGGMSPTSSMIMMADGILVGLNFFDNQIYAFGKGPSATTVTASPEISVHGNKVMIKGTVTDQTDTGKRDINNIVDFTLEDTPAISDEDMDDWMEYMFMQQAKPADAKGVEVVLTVVDPNSNVYEIGRVTSDVEGNYALPFEPLVPGDYQIIASFAGTKAYGPSSATTYLTVEEAPAATPMPTPPPASVADMYLLPSVAGIIVAIVVIGIVIILMLRRR